MIEKYAYEISAYLVLNTHRICLWWFKICPWGWWDGLASQGTPHRPIWVQSLRSFLWHVPQKWKHFLQEGKKSLGWQTGDKQRSHVWGQTPELSKLGEILKAPTQQHREWTVLGLEIRAVNMQKEKGCSDWSFLQAIESSGRHFPVSSPRMAWVFWWCSCYPSTPDIDHNKYSLAYQIGYWYNCYFGLSWTPIMGWFLCVKPVIQQSMR